MHMLVSLAFASLALQAPPLVETAELLGSQTQTADRFGDAVALDGERLLVGAHVANTATGLDAGEAYVFVRSGATWSEEARLEPLDPAVSDEFGDAVALSGDTALIAATRDDDLGTDSGSVYVFRRSGTSWAQEAKLVGSSTVAGDRFGLSVALDGDTALIGAPENDDAGFHYGAAYVFVRSGTSWSEEAKLLPVPGGAPFYLDFGRSVAIDGHRAVVGTRLPSSQGGGIVFERTGTSWTDVAFPTGGGELGWSAGIQEDTLILGAPRVSGDFPAFDAGSVSVYAYAGTSWGFETSLRVAAPTEDQWLGTSVDLCGDWIIGGAPMDMAGGEEAGAAYVFQREGTGWTERARLTAGVPNDIDRFGTSVATWGGVFAVGTPGRDSNGNSAGSVFVFENPFATFCDAWDDSLSACPCANPGDPDTGCDIQQATGGVRLEVLAQETLPLNRATLTGSSFPAASTPTAIVIRAAQLDGTSPVVFGDGLRCVGTPIVRLGAAFALGGASTHTFGHGTGAGSGTFYYQLWFRNTPVMYCDPSAAFNLSGGRVLDW